MEAVLCHPSTSTPGLREAFVVGVTVPKETAANVAPATPIKFPEIGVERVVAVCVAAVNPTSCTPIVSPVVAARSARTEIVREPATLNNPAGSLKVTMLPLVTEELSVRRVLPSYRYTSLREASAEIPILFKVRLVTFPAPLKVK
jgi:hypothetical protein